MKIPAQEPIRLNRAPEPVTTADRCDCIDPDDAAGRTATHSTEAPALRKALDVANTMTRRWAREAKDLRAQLDAVTAERDRDLEALIADRDRLAALLARATKSVEQLSRERDDTRAETKRNTALVAALRAQHADQRAIAAERIADAIESEIVPGGTGGEVDGLRYAARIARDHAKETRPPAR